VKGQSPECFHLKDTANCFITVKFAGIFMFSVQQNTDCLMSPEIAKFVLHSI